MSEGHFLKRRWKLILNIITVIALVGLAIAIRGQLLDTFAHLAEVHAWVLLAVLPLQWLNYHAQTEMYRSLFRILGDRLRYKFLFRTSVELNFVNHVFPSGGVTGISYFGVHLRNERITATKATLVQFVKLGLLFLSFEILLIAGLLLLAISDQANDVVLLVTGSISTLLVVGTGAFMAIIGSQRRIHGTFLYVTRLLNRLLHVVRPQHPETISTKRIEHVVLDLHNNYMLIKSHYRELRGPFLWALILNITEILKVYVVYLAFGEWVNLGAVILAYAVANFAGLVSVMPGGIGIYEALMTGVLATSGVPAHISLPVTVMYRVISTLIQIPPGYYLYNQTLHKNPDEVARMREMHDDLVKQLED